MEESFVLHDQKTIRILQTSPISLSFLALKVACLAFWRLDHSRLYALSPSPFKGWLFKHKLNLKHQNTKHYPLSQLCPQPLNPSPLTPHPSPLKPTGCDQAESLSDDRITHCDCDPLGRLCPPDCRGASSL